MSFSILIVEDIPITQAWMAQAAQLAFPQATTHCTSTIKEARELIHQLKPTLSLVDLKLPDGTGEKFISEIVARHPDCINIVITIYADENHLLSSLKAGARGYILKDQSKSKIAQMLKQALAGELPLSPAAARLVLQQFSQAQDQSSLTQLSPRETEVLQCIASGDSTPVIASKLTISKYTVEDHIKKIYKKLNVSNRVEAALVAHQRGLIS
ncbi:MAG TPA: response regulator transcription factor [Gammaproteobacteria bacterium]|nr:response regulator transcription factor [Gammaproteobacteria bacterium]